MATSKVTQQQSFQTWAHSVGEISIQGRLESRYSPSGKLLFVLAFVPRSDFEEKYGIFALSAIVHKGRVFVLENRQGRIVFTDCFHGQTLDVEFTTDRFGFSCLKMMDHRHTLCRKHIGYDEEQSFQFDLNTIRWLAEKFDQLLPLKGLGQNDTASSGNLRTTLHIVPEEEDTGEESSDFQRSSVLFH